jgi:hypothetical protein
VAALMNRLQADRIAGQLFENLRLSGAIAQPRGYALKWAALSENVQEKWRRAVIEALKGHDGEPLLIKTGFK